MKKVYILVHIVVWLIFLELVIGLGALMGSMIMLLEGEPFFDEALIYIPTLILFFYINAYFLIPRYLNKRDWGKYLLLLFFVFFGLIGLVSILLLQLKRFGYHFNIDAQDVFDDLGLINLIILGLSSSFAISKIAFRNMQMKKEAEKQQIAAELQLLKAQLKPHFLFNSLNTIYSLADEEKAPKTTGAVLKLSEMMRYILGEARQSKVSLSKEVQFLQNFIDLQKHRLSEEISVDFKVKNLDQELEIVPLLLISFVENCFKHGISYQQPSPILIELEMEKGELKFYTKNAIVKNNRMETTGIGIENAQKRLAYLYPNKHQLKFGQDNGIFEVELRIDL